MCSSYWKQTPISAHFDWKKKGVGVYPGAKSWLLRPSGGWVMHPGRFRQITFPFVIQMGTYINLLVCISKRITKRSKLMKTILSIQTTKEVKWIILVIDFRDIWEFRNPLFENFWFWSGIFQHDVSKCKLFVTTQVIPYSNKTKITFYSKGNSSIRNPKV